MNGEKLTKIEISQVQELYRDTKNTYRIIAIKMGWQHFSNKGRSKVAGVLDRYPVEAKFKRGNIGGRAGRTKKIAGDDLLTARKIIDHGGSQADISRALKITPGSVRSVVKAVARTAKKPETQDELKKQQEFRGCRYIHGDTNTDDWYMCQEKQQSGSSYCAIHHADTHLTPEQARISKANAKAHWRQYKKNKKHPWQ